MTLDDDLFMAVIGSPSKIWKWLMSFYCTLSWAAA